MAFPGVEDGFEDMTNEGEHILLGSVPGEDDDDSTTDGAPYRCAFVSPEGGQCVKAMYHEGAHEYNPSLP